MIGSFRDRTIRNIERRLRELDTRIVLAESCSGGAAAAEFVRNPGISEVFCGSLVSYRLDSKTQWLGVSEETLRRYGEVSSEVARAMALEALKRTPEAGVSGAITGYIGSTSPEGRRGELVVACAFKHGLEEQLSLSRNEPLRTQLQRSEVLRTEAGEIVIYVKKIRQSHGAFLRTKSGQRAHEQRSSANALLNWVRYLLSDFDGT